MLDSTFSIFTRVLYELFLIRYQDVQYSLLMNRRALSFSYINRKLCGFLILSNKINQTLETTNSCPWLGLPVQMALHVDLHLPTRAKVYIQQKEITKLYFHVNRIPAIQYKRWPLCTSLN